MDTVNLKSNPLSPLTGLFVGLCVTLALTFGVLQMVTAETLQTTQKGSPDTEQRSLTDATAIPESVSFMVGTVTFTWLYRTETSMPFTEHHSISTQHLSDALTQDGPVRVATKDSGELLIATMNDTPNIILSARRYSDWTLISVLKSSDDPTHSTGVFKFCSMDIDASLCANSVLQYPDGTVTMTNGEPATEMADMSYDLDSTLITEKLAALLTL